MQTRKPGAAVRSRSPTSERLPRGFRMTERRYRIQVAAELAGISEGLLRAWERRYRLVKPRRTPAGYRAYSDQEIALLKRVKRLTDEGMSIGDASRLVPAIRRELDEQGPS